MRKFISRITGRHWSFLPTGLSLAVLLIVFWFFNQSYLAPSKGLVASLLENPLPTFVLILLGAYVAASLSGEFRIKAPLTIEPLVLALAGGFVAGAGAMIAEMSIHSVVLFSLAGVFTLPAFLIVKGWIYIAVMTLGGLVGARLLVLILVRTGRAEREVRLPVSWRVRAESPKGLYVAGGLLGIGLLAAGLAPLAAAEKTGLLLAMVLLALFGFVAERGTVCLSSMLKEWFISHSAYVWRSVLFTIMCLALLYQAGLSLGLYEPIAIEATITSPVLLLTGSFLMGFGFVFADGCFIGSLWKAAQGNLVNVAGLVGLLVGMGMVLAGRKIVPLAPEPTNVPNQLAAVASPWLWLAIMWAAGLLALFVFRPKRYRY